MYQDYKVLLVEKQQKIVIARFNNPKKKNSLNVAVYEEITRLLEHVNNDAEITIVVFTGVGDYFTSGNDLSQKIQTDDIEAHLDRTNAIFKRMIESFINCTKVILSLVNGPSIGIGASIVALSDIAWAADNAYILAPFGKLGIVPEGTSSFLLPRILGRSKASEVLLFSEPLSAQEAYQFNLVSRLFKLSDLDTIIWPKIHQFSQLPPGSLQISKSLMQLHLRESMQRANQAECQELRKRFQSEEFIQAIMDFAMRKTKSKSKL